MRVVLLAALAGLPCGVSYAQPSAAAAPREATGLGAFIAGEITRIALLDLRSVETPRPSDFTITIEVLRLAQSLDPNSGDIARRICEAAWSAGDQAALLEATERLIKIDPGDTVALLRLLTARISQMQTAEQRLSAYDAALGDVGKGLDPAIRSRLALDAALLLKERGDEAGFVQRLTMATALDSTNKDAALLALNYFSDRVSGDPLGKLELLSNLLMADPLDPKVHAQLRDEFATAGAFKAALRFHTSVGTIYAAAGIPETADHVVRSFVLDWRGKGARGMLDALNQNLQQQRANVGRPGSEQASAFNNRPEDVRLGAPFEEVRLAAALVLDRPNDVAASLQDMGRSTRSKVELLTDLTRRPTNITAEDAAEEVRLTLGQHHLWQCLAAAVGPSLEGAQPSITPPGETAEDPNLLLADNGAESSPLNDAWRAIRDKEDAKAMDLLDRAGDSLWVSLGRAVVLERTEADGEAARAYRRVAETAPLSAMGSLAAHRDEALVQRSGAARPPVALIAGDAEEFANSIPAWVDAMASRPGSFQSMRAEAATNKSGTLDRGNVRVILRNLSPAPMGLGSGRAISTRLLFVPALEGRIPMNRLEPEVFELDRRLRLMPSEEVQYVLWPEVGEVGFAIQQSGEFPTRVRWRVIQGFETARDGTRHAGLGCMESQIDVGILHEAMPETRVSGEQLASRLRTADETALPELLVAARLRLLQRSDPSLNPMMDTLVARYPTMSPAARLLVLTAMPSAARVPEAKELDAAVLREKDPRVMLMGVLLRTKGPDDPIMAAGLALNDPALTRVVESIKDRYARHANSRGGADAANPPPAAPPAAETPLRAAPPVPQKP